MVRGLLTLRKRSFTRLVYIAVLHLCLAVGFVRLPRELKGEGPGCRAPIPPAPRGGVPTPGDCGHEGAGLAGCLSPTSG